MSLSRIRPIPRAILIAAIVGAAIFGASKFMPKSAPEPVAPVAEEQAPPVERVSPQENAETAVQAARDAAQDVQPTPQPPVEQQQDQSSNTGLDAVLRAGKR